MTEPQSKHYHFASDLHVLETERLEKPTRFARLVAGKLPNPRSICLYVISCDNSVVYVGSSKDAGRTLASGHLRNYPYKWLKSHCSRELKANLFSFDCAFDDLRLEHVREAIEGEVVFEIRRRTGRWPEAQNEIH